MNRQTLAERLRAEAQLYGLWARVARGFAAKAVLRSDHDHAQAELRHAWAMDLRRTRSEALALRAERSTSHE